MEPSDASKLQLLRLRLESETKSPALVMVTSAQPKDGKSLTAFGLAECLARAGHRVALVHVLPEPVASAPRSRPLVNGLFSFMTLPAGADAPVLSRDAVQSFVQTMRATYDYALVDAGALMSSSVALLFAAAADAVLLAVRHGRQPCETDGLMVETLRQLRARILGVIAASPESIRAFEHASQADDLATATRFAPHGPDLNDVSNAPALAQ